jgi:hypothetical protein
MLTVRHIIHNSWNIVDSGINTNKNGHHVLHYAWHIVESVAKHPNPNHRDLLKATKFAPLIFFCYQ